MHKPFNRNPVNQTNRFEFQNQRWGREGDDPLLKTQ